MGKGLWSEAGPKPSLSFDAPSFSSFCFPSMSSGPNGGRRSHLKGQRVTSEPVLDPLTKRDINRNTNEHRRRRRSSLEELYITLTTTDRPEMNFFSAERGVPRRSGNTLSYGDVAQPDNNKTVERCHGERTTGGERSPRGS
ncbi:hypothetical protein EYF80_009463 [Liparis tanakae]|uniref:Uncharacterized protein n=1 Tax=Liparis tanakae TaxID=230148 RepID=A0A4Z2IR34_9TELE|nr:hypothetical protein EYF80_009463 [Liparis tanakae]